MKRIVSIFCIAVLTVGVCWAKKKTSDKVYDVGMDNVRTLEAVKDLLEVSKLDEMTVRLRGVKILSVEELTNPYDESKGKFAIVCMPGNEGQTVSIEVTKFLFSNPLFEKNLSSEKLYDITFTCAVEEPVSKAKSKISKAASTVTFGLINSKDAEEYQQLTAKDITETSESGDDAGTSGGNAVAVTELKSDKQRKAEEKQKKAEEKQRAAEEKQRKAEEKQRKAEEERLRKEEVKRQQEEEKRRKAEEERLRREAVSDPANIEYKEISATDFCEKLASNKKAIFARLDDSKGWKITNVYINGANRDSYKGKEDILLFFRGVDTGKVASAYALEFLQKIYQEDPTWSDRLDAVAENQRYNGHYTIWLYGKKDGRHSNATVYNIEGVPSQEQIDKGLEYKEISATEYCEAIGNMIWYGTESYDDQKKVLKSVDNFFSNSEGFYKVTGVYIRNIDVRVPVLKENRFGDDKGVQFSDSENKKIMGALFGDYKEKMDQKDPTWIKRLSYVYDDRNFNGHYVLYLQGKKENGHVNIYLQKIEGIPTQEEIEALKEEKRLAAEKIEQEWPELTIKKYEAFKDKYQNKKFRIKDIYVADMSNGKVTCATKEWIGFNFVYKDYIWFDYNDKIAEELYEFMENGSAIDVYCIGASNNWNYAKVQKVEKHK